jgi:SAM-dependent methyltransferase
VAESFGSDAARYDRSRPRYPDGLIERMLATSPGLDVLDVGCGTGIVARPFQAAGARVLGVDPDARMADFARAHGTEVEVANFEDWEPAGRTFDAVVAGQTWHWVDPVAGAAKAAQVLRPGGRLAVFWNAFQPPPELAEAFTAVYRRLLPDAPLFQRAMPGPEGYLMLCDKAADGFRSVDAFDEPEQWRFDWDQPYTRDEWLDFLPTSGGFSQLSPSKVDEVLAGIGAALDAIGGSFPMHYGTVVATATRT